VTSILSPDKDIDRKVYKVTYHFTNRFIYFKNNIGIEVGKRRVIRMALENPRAQRGLQILASEGAVKRVSEREYKVKSQSKDGYYDVIYDGAKWVCSCPDYQENAQFCKHCWAVDLSLKIRLTVEEHTHQDIKVISVKESHKCPHCESNSVIRNGYRKCLKGLNQLYECKDCGKKFSIDNGFSRIHVNAKIVVTAYDLWANGLSPRKIANHIKGIYKLKVGKSTVDRWISVSQKSGTYGTEMKPHYS
jgi:transposase-like protein